jgi:phospholipid-binding lipoprotein MlaA
MPSSFPRLRAFALCTLVSMILLGGCASVGNPRDPLEPVNRGIYQFNDAVDTMLLKPAAEVYRGVLPQFARTGVSNFFSNINDVLIALNNLLQGKVSAAASDVGRVAVNTTVGLLGLIDVATQIGLEKHNEDFGQTLGRWGIGDGPYLVLPLLGPSNLRDAFGRIADYKTDPVTYVDPTRDRNLLMGLRLVNQRAELLGATSIFETAALDPYEFLRDAYLQRRRNLIYDGNPPPESDGDFELKPGPRSERQETSPFPHDTDGRLLESTVVVSGEPASAMATQGTSSAVAPPATAAAPQTEPHSPRIVRFWGTASSVSR